MNTGRLWEILRATSVQLRKGNEVEGDPALVEAIKDFRNGDDLAKLPGGVVHLYMMPHISEAVPNLELVDVHFVVIGVDKEKAESHRDELIAILNDYPEPERLAGGPSYIELGAVIGDQGAALQLMAIGQVLGFWKFATPEMLGFTGDEASELAGKGMVMIDGYRPAKAPAVAPKV